MQSTTFEDVVLENLAELHAGAMFLAGGEPPAAESLLTDTLLAAFPAYATLAGPPTRWLEARLAREAMRRGRSGQRRRPAGDLDARQTPLQASADMPARVRAAIWLVTFLRWPPEEAARTLDVPADEIPDLLAWQGTLLPDAEGDVPTERSS